MELADGGNGKKIEPLLDLRDLLPEGGSVFHGWLWRKRKITLDLGISFVVLSDACRKRRNIRAYCFRKAEHFSQID